MPPAAELPHQLRSFTPSTEALGGGGGTGEGWSPLGGWTRRPTPAALGYPCALVRCPLPVWRGLPARQRSKESSANQRAIHKAAKWSPRRRRCVADFRLRLLLCGMLLLKRGVPLSEKMSLTCKGSVGVVMPLSAQVKMSLTCTGISSIGFSENSSTC